MNISISFNYTEGYLPTPRSRKLRYREASDTYSVHIREVDKDEFPVGLRYQDFIMKLARPERRWIDLHWYEGSLWVLSRASDYFANASWEEPLPIDSLENFLTPRSYDVGACPDKESCIKAIQKRAEKWLICDGRLYEKSGEPMYNICTFGLGHNHAGIGTSLGVSCRYNGNLPSKWYFNALQRKEAIAAAKEVAMRRGDTDSIWYIESAEDIKVILPECVQADPQSWDKQGDPWLNKIEEITESSKDLFTAGLLTCIACKKGYA